MQESRSKDFKCSSRGSSHEGIVSNLRNNVNYQNVTILDNSSDTTSEQGVYFWTSNHAKKASSWGSSCFWMERIIWSASRNIYKIYLSSVAPLMKYFSEILSIVILNIATGPGAPVTGPSKAFQPGHRKNLCSPAKHLHTHTF